MGLDGYRVHGQLRRQWGIKFPANKDFYPQYNTNMFHHPPYNGDTAQLGGAKNRAWCVTDPSLGVCLQNRGDVIIKVRDLEKAQDVAIRYCQPAKDGIDKRQDISKALPWSHHQVMVKADGTLSAVYTTSML